MNGIARRSDFFNQDSICIFTDSSFKKTKTIGTQISGYVAPAYVVFRNDQCIESGYHILADKNSQQGELIALHLGLIAAGRYRNFPHIRIFGDNQNAIIGTRQWIFKWVSETRNGRNTLGHDGRISNQDLFMDIFNTIMYNNIYVELYHIKGHVNIKSWKDRKISREMFLRSNPYFSQIEDALIDQLAFGNNMVDQLSTVMLNSHARDRNFIVTRPFTQEYMPFDMHKYISLVNKDGEHRNFDKAWMNKKK